MAPAMPCVQLVRFVESAKQVLFGTVLNVFLVCIPLALLSDRLRIGNVRASSLMLCELNCKRRWCSHCHSLTLFSFAFSISFNFTFALWLAIFNLTDPLYFMVAVMGFSVQFGRNCSARGTARIHYRVSLYFFLVLHFSFNFFLTICDMDRVVPFKCNCLILRCLQFRVYQTIGVR